MTERETVVKSEKGLIIALDLDDPAQARALVEKVGSAGDFYKVAPTMTLKDPSFIPWLLDLGKRVFLDCKWYDIPSQVQRSVKTAGESGVYSCTIHASAGSAVMKAALEALPRPRVWAVTVLTSLGDADLKELGVEAKASEQVLRLAKLAQAQGIDGLVCSPLEISLLRKNAVTAPLITPGISWGGAGGKDQKRTAGPREAWEAGADFIVVGRSILEAPNPSKAVQEILKERP